MLAQIYEAETKHPFIGLKLCWFEIQGQPVPMRDAIHRRLGWVTEPQILFPLLPQGLTGDAKLQFSRRLNAPNAAFDGVVIVEVDAGFFVSGYKP